MKDALLKKSQRVGFADKPGIATLRVLFPILAKIAPGYAAKLALRIFLTPPRYKEPAWEAQFSDSAEQQVIQSDGKNVVVYSWGHGEKKILLCHAWGGRGTQLAKFVESLVAAGFRVVAFDAPGHGRSSGRSTDMMEYSSAIHAVEKYLGGFDALVAHSFGAGNAMFSVSRFRIQTSRIILIGCFSHGKWVIQKFGEILNIPAQVVTKMCHILEKKYDGHLIWDKLDIVEMLRESGIPALIIHDENDQEIPYEHARKFRSIDQRIWFHDTQKLGHRRIVQSPQVIGRVVDFLKG